MAAKNNSFIPNRKLCSKQLIKTLDQIYYVYVAGDYLELSRTSMIEPQKKNSVADVRPGSKYASM